MNNDPNSRHRRQKKKSRPKRTSITKALRRDYKDLAIATNNMFEAAAKGGGKMIVRRNVSMDEEAQALHRMGNALERIKKRGGL